tara:strand:+ start:1080 stop:1670 length:591 start_codon:yes stop_codon:yes gene_type:complete
MLKKIILYNFVFSFVFLAQTQSAEDGGMPQLNPEFWISQIFWLILTFGILLVVLSKLILPKISNNIETRRSQILENIETAEKQRLESENKIKEFEKIINKSNTEAKNYFNSARQKILKDIDKKRESLEIEINKEIEIAEKEILDLKKSAYEKIHKIAVETSSDLIKQLIDADVNNSNISAIVEDLYKKNKEKYNGI